jgi:hypothetical protein
MTFLGPSGMTVELVEAEPAPPRVGLNSWTLRLESAEGDPVTGAVLSLTPFMPSMGHGSPRRPTVSELDGGTYLASPVQFTMPGYWRTTVTVEASGLTDAVRIAFCVML